MILAEAATFAISVRAVGALVAGVAVMFLTIRVFGRIYTPLVAPIAGVGKRADGDDKISLYGPWLLIASYYFCGTILALTGATIGMSPDVAWTPKGIHQPLIWGFTAGMMVAALARISAVYLTTSLATYLQLLTVATLGVVAFKFAQNFDSISKFIDSFNPLFRESSGRRLVPFSLMTTVVTVGAVELGIYLCSLFPKGNIVPYSLVRERSEQHETALQVFWPKSIVRFTNRILKDKIGKEGLDELCWLTHTAPLQHMETAFKALQSKHPGIGAPDLLNTFKAVTRVLVSSTLTNEERIHLADYVKASNISYIPRPVRTRLLIINAKYAIIHLPIPFRGGTTEQSNCAFLVSSEERVQKLRDAFNLLWEKQLHFLALERILKGLVLGQSEHQLFRATRVVYEFHRPVRSSEVAAALRHRGDETATTQKVKILLNKLEAHKILRHVGEDLWCPTSNARTCRIAEILFDLD